MPKLSAGVVVLALTLCSYPLRAQQASVALSVCNKGAVDFDVFISLPSRLDGGHVATGACLRVYVDVGGSPPPAYLGFAFVDSTGKWGAAKGLDLLPTAADSEGRAIGEVRQADQSVVVPHGNSKVSLPFQLLFRPRSPICRPRNIVLPYNATAADRAYADSLARNAPPACEDLAASLNVVVYPDSREITFLDDGEAPPQSQRMEWNHMSDFLSTLFSEAAQREARNHHTVLNKNIVIQGTIASFKLPLPGASELWTDVYFKESPDKAFNFCTSTPDIFKAVFGPNFSTSMIGKTVQVEGEISRAYCQSGAGIRVSLTRQLHVSDKELPEIKANADRSTAVARPKEAEPARPRDLKEKTAIVQRDAALNDRRKSVADVASDWDGKNLMVKGTVSRVELKPIPTAPQSYWVMISFKESPGFLICFADSPTNSQNLALRGIGGGTRFSGLVGKVVQGETLVGHPQCASNALGMDLRLPASQLTVY